MRKSRQLDQLGEVDFSGVRWLPRWPVAACAFFWLMPAVAFALGGPPMLTDDPDTPGNGRWEINLAGVSEFSSVEQATAFPYVDANYGWGERLQLKLEMGWVYASGDRLGSHRGLGTGTVGVKWRFFEEKGSGLSISTYPQVEFRTFLSSDDPEVARSGARTLIPFEVEKELGWPTLVFEGGYLAGRSEPSGWIYGMIFGHSFDESHEAMLELRGQSQVDGEGNELLLNAGVTYGLTEAVRLIASLGHTLVTERDELSHFISYAGLQLRF